MTRVPIELVEVPAGSNDGDVPTYDAATDELVLAAPAGGGVETVVAGDNIAVDSTDPANPVVSTARWEVLMASGVTPPEPLESSDGYDWLYGEVPE